MRSCSWIVHSERDGKLKWADVIEATSHAGEEDEALTWTQTGDGNLLQLAPDAQPLADQRHRRHASTVDDPPCDWGRPAPIDDANKEVDDE